jgi:hypothetical protein
MARAGFVSSRVAVSFAKDALLRTIAYPLDCMRARTLEVVVVGVMRASAAEALVLTQREPAFRRGEVVSHLVASGALHE